VEQVTGVPGVVVLSRARCSVCAPSAFGYAVVVPPGGFAWHELQFVISLGSEMWHEVQSGAPDTGDVPVTA
jgi:hypothetical protein